MTQHEDRANPGAAGPDIEPGMPGFTPPSAEPSRAPVYWRSLEEYAGTSEFRQWAEREFPELATELDESYAEGGVSRRRFLQLMAASIALAGVAGVSGCRRNEERILPYNNKPADAVPGRAMYYATTMVLAGQPIGVLAETHEGRPTKIEGNPLHPASQGATHAFAQASVLDLYDPERSRRVLHKGQPARWKEDFLAFLEKHVPELRPGGGAKLAILSEDYASPAMEVLREHLAKAMPHATFHVYEPAWFTAGPQPACRLHDISSVDVILALDCDFLGLEDDGTRYQRQFASRRGVTKPEDGMNRLYVVEPCYTLTGVAADHHLRLKASAVGEYAKQLLAVLQGQAPQATAGVDPRWLSAVAGDLKSHPGKALVLVGRRQPQWVHEVAAAINQALGLPPARTDRALPAAASIADLAKRIAGGEVGTLLILGGNPAYDAPADLDFASLIRSRGSPATTISASALPRSR
ncbi:MAG TPA: TAT-variant-translocated molybdopterin oxidoreductase [Tepidisphaeraceae bacterium]|nr:TAT-variant-translocated molybdopterin oxidoreductase [Tepidisphaeraceae bacterium]